MNDASAADHPCLNMDRLQEKSWSKKAASGAGSELLT
jgi:hypothetical protein